jgi:hypothetical protein
MLKAKSCFPLNSTCILLKSRFRQWPGLMAHLLDKLATISAKSGGLEKQRQFEIGSKECHTMLKDLPFLRSSGI